jgi:hypothetical protein
MQLEPTGFELIYRDSVQDVNHVESSYVLYGTEFADIQAIYRYVDDLSPEDLAQRQRELKRYFHPGLLVRLVRNMQHFVSLASDSLTEVLGMIMGQLRKPAGRYIGNVSDAQFARLSTAVVGTIGTTYDPLLERFIGDKVVVDLLEGEESHEHVAVFKNYSADFIELLDVQYPQPQTYHLSGQPDNRVAKSLVTERDGKILRVRNTSEQPILIQSIRMSNAPDADEEMLNVVVDGGEVVELQPVGLTDDATLVVRIVRELDMVVPRTRCVIRHRADRYEPSVIPEIIFDIGVILRGDSRTDARIERLRKQLEEEPHSAIIASNLGTLLMKQENYTEALTLLEQAYEARYSLPDNGKRTLMLIHELKRRSSKSPQQADDMRQLPPTQAVPALQTAIQAPPEHLTQANGAAGQLIEMDTAAASEKS